MKRLLWFLLLFVMICCAERAKAQNPATLNIPNSRIQGGVNGNCLYDNAGKLGSKTCGGGGGNPPAGPPLGVQNNNAGAFGANAAFVANYSVISAPSAPVITHSGTAGMATWGYTIVAGLIGGVPVALGSAPSAEGQTATGNATLTSMNFNIITPPACVANSGVTSFDIYRTTTGSSPTTVGLIGNVPCGGNLHDTGLPLINPLFSYVADDYSIGVGLSIPLVVQTNGSAFGSLAMADLETNSSYFNDDAFSLGVYERTSTAGYGGQTFGVYTIVDSNASALSAFIDVDVQANLTGTVNGLAVSILSSGFNSSSALVGTTSSVAYSGSEKALQMIGLDAAINASTVQQIDMFYASGANISGAVDVMHVYYGSAPAGAGTITTYVQFWGADLGASGSLITNPYYSWNDSRGIRRDKEDPAYNGTGQDIQCLYNNSFPKYTPGAADFERGCLGAWDASNVFHVYTEAGGIGASRKMQFDALDVQTASQFALIGNIVNPFLETKNTQSATAPGATLCDLRWIAGTTGSSGKIVAACGTSATEVTIADNVGTGF